MTETDNELQKKIREQEIQVEATRVTLEAHEKELRDMERQYRRKQGANHLRVSDHAVIRYLERIDGVDIDDIRDKIVDEEIRRQVSLLGGHGTYVNKEQTYRVRVEDNVIVTIIPEQRINQ